METLILQASWGIEVYLITIFILLYMLGRAHGKNQRNNNQNR